MMPVRAPVGTKLGAVKESSDEGREPGWGSRSCFPALAVTGWGQVKISPVSAVPADVALLLSHRFRIAVAYDPIRALVTVIVTEIPRNEPNVVRQAGDCMALSAEASIGVRDRPGRVATALGLLITQRWSPVSRTAVDYSNASDPERRPEASSDARPAPTTLTNRPGTSSHRGAGTPGS
jgi:hypothetical protein